MGKNALHRFFPEGEMFLFFPKCGSDSTCKVSTGNTQFTNCSRKYFSNTTALLATKLLHYILLEGNHYIPCCDWPQVRRSKVMHE